MADFRALCAKLSVLLEELHSLVSVECPRILDEDSGGSWKLDLDTEDALDGARAALAQPEPEGPSDEELDLVVIAIQALIPPQPDATTHHLSAVDRGREILRQRLARWGNPQGT
jgi:hypothetical protein